MPFPRAPLIAALLVGAILAGCAEPATPTAPAPSQPAIEVAEDRPGTSFGEIVTGPAAAPDLTATTAAPPRLVPGEWWKIRFSSPVLESSYEFVRVVAAVEAPSGTCDASSPQPTGCGGYVMGMPHEGWLKEAIAFHAPAFGDVGLDLSYATHNHRFQAVRFPLAQGATWETVFGGPVTATVESADEFTATIRFDAPPSDPQPTDPLFAALNPIGDLGPLRIVYDARQHEVVKFDAGFAAWEVLEHGYGFEGWVTVPRGLYTAFDHGQFLTATPGQPVLTRTQTVEGGFNRLTIVHGVFAFAPGAYRVRAIAPNGTEYVTESRGEKSFTLNFHEAVDPDGEWTLEDLVAGAGGTYTMGMAYHQYDIRLPDGARRTDHSHPIVR